MFLYADGISQLAADSRFLRAVKVFSSSYRLLGFWRYEYQRNGMCLVLDLASHSVKVSDVYSLQDFSKAVESLKNKEAPHIVISPGQ